MRECEESDGKQGKQGTHGCMGCNGTWVLACAARARAACNAHETWLAGCRTQVISAQMVPVVLSGHGGHENLHGPSGPAIWTSRMSFGWSSLQF